MAAGLNIARVRSGTSIDDAAAAVYANAAAMETLQHPGARYYTQPQRTLQPRPPPQTWVAAVTPARRCQADNCYYNVAVRDLTCFRLDQSMVDTCVALYSWSATSADSARIPAQANYWMAVAAGMWIRSNPHWWLGAEQGVTEHPECPYKPHHLETGQEDILSTPSHIYITMIGVPHTAVMHDVIAKLQSLGLDPVDSSLHVSSSQAEHRAYPVVHTVYVTILVANTPTAWAMISSCTWHWWDTGLNRQASNLLVFRLDQSADGVSQSNLTLLTSTRGLSQMTWCRWIHGAQVPIQPAVCVHAFWHLAPWQLQPFNAVHSRLSRVVHVVLVMTGLCHHAHTHTHTQ